MVKALAMFRFNGDNFFIDCRLREFRSMDMMKIIKFDSQEGDEMLSKAINEDLLTNEELYAIW